QPLSMGQPESPFQTVVRHDYYDPTLTQARLTLMWRVPGMNKIEETYALDVLSSILGSGRTARLVKELREEKGLISGLSVHNMAYAHQGIFTISVSLPDEHISIVHQAITEHIAELHYNLVTPYELQRVQTQVANRYVFGNETPDNRAGLYGYYQTLAGRLEPAIHYPTRIRELTAQDLRQAAQTYLSPDAYGMVIIHPTTEPISD
ncbi:MAG: insulinase family protein, partial [Symploca sp. SIO2B6]|nr:insulinase family protein [Symploca sp. SIO2B6]